MRPQIKLQRNLRATERPATVGHLLFVPDHFQLERSMLIRAFGQVL